MKYKPSNTSDTSLRDDVEELLEQSIVEEVVQEIWKRYERALSRLSPEDLHVVESFFGEKPIENLVTNFNLSPTQEKALIGRAKHELLRQLQGETKLRQ